MSKIQSRVPPIVRNPILETPRHELLTEHGVFPKRLPTGLSQAPVVVKRINDPRTQELSLVAGFIGVTQDSKSGSLQPEIGWAVVERNGFSRLVNELVPVHERRSRSSKRLFNAPVQIINGMPKELVELMDQVGAEYTFFAGTRHPWHLKSVSDLATRVVLRNRSSQIVTQFMELGDGRHIAYLPMYGCKERSQEWWFVVGRFQTDHVMAIQAVMAKGLPQLLERMISSRGRYYFDDPDFVSDGFL